jgi:hypothetical protein
MFDPTWRTIHGMATTQSVANRHDLLVGELQRTDGNDHEPNKPPKIIFAD